MGGCVSPQGMCYIVKNELTPQGEEKIFGFPKWPFWA